MGAKVGVRVPRTREESESFNRGLQRTVNLFYGSEKTSVWMMSKAPSHRKYKASGWCTTEQFISSIITPSRGLLDLGEIYDPESRLPLLEKVEGTIEDELCITVGGVETRGQHAAFQQEMETFAGSAVFVDPTKILRRNNMRDLIRISALGQLLDSLAGAVVVVKWAFTRAVQPGFAVTDLIPFARAMTKANAVAVLVIHFGDDLTRLRIKTEYDEAKDITIPVLFLPASAAELFERDGETQVTFKKNQKIVTWDSSVMAKCTKFKREPPKRPEEFNEVIDSKHFTSGSDVDKVKKIFSKNYAICIKGARQLAFSNLEWSDDDLAMLTPVMTDCHQLLVLDLHGNSFSRAGLKMLLPYLKSIRVLDVRGVPLNHSDLTDIDKACPRLIKLRADAIGYSRFVITKRACQCPRLIKLHADAIDESR